MILHINSVWGMLMYLQAYDSHCNLVLGDVEETVYVVEEDEEEEEVLRVGIQSLWPRKDLLTFFLQTIHKKSEMLFVRGMFRFYTSCRFSHRRWSQMLISTQATAWSSSPLKHHHEIRASSGT